MVNRAVDFLASNIEDIEDVYSLAITTYALHLADHPQRDTAFYKLEGKAEVKGQLLQHGESGQILDFFFCIESSCYEIKAYATLVFVTQEL